jgi:hypothetical protein
LHSNAKPDAGISVDSSTPTQTAQKKPMFPSPEQTRPRPVATPLLGMAAVLTVAWFAIAAMTIAPSPGAQTATGYGIDELPAPNLIAQR